MKKNEHLANRLEESSKRLFKEYANQDDRDVAMSRICRALALLLREKNEN